MNKLNYSRRSSMVEQGFCYPPAGGSIPSGGSIFNLSTKCRKSNRYATANLVLFNEHTLQAYRRSSNRGVF